MENLSVPIQKPIRGGVPGVEHFSNSHGLSEDFRTVLHFSPDLPPELDQMEERLIPRA